MNRQAPGSQPVRGMPGFPGQQGQPTRAASRGANSQPGWAFGMQNGNGQGLGTSQARPGGSSTFAQSLGGGQSSGPLDLSDFPSLGGAPHSQFPSTGQAVWSNQRPGLQGSLQRGQQGQSASLGDSEHGQQSLDEAFFSGGGANASLDDYRHGGQSGLGQLSNTGQSQPDDFPPLGRGAQGDMGQNRRMNLMQSAAGGGFPTTSYSGPSDSRATSGSMHQSQDGLSGFQNGSNEANMFSDLISSQHNGQNSTQPDNVLAGIGGSAQPDPSNGANQDVGSSPVEMSDRDRYGLRGLLENIRSGEPHNLAIGIDLTNLGLDLNSSEPLYPTFGGPFAAGPARPIQPDFTLPSCYNVGNVHHLEDKISSFQDETLFWIFYHVVRDIAQELAAEELTKRNWRYHKVLRLWITKEQTYGEPQVLTNDVERGRYVVFNNEIWRRENRDLIIRYADLDDHITPTLGSSGLV